MKDEWARTIRELVEVIQGREIEPEFFVMRFETKAEAKAAIKLYQRRSEGTA